MLDKIGEKIVHFRDVNNLTIKDFSKITNLSTASISQLERGIGNPTISVLSSIAKALDMPLAELVSETIDNKNMVCRSSDRKILFDNNHKHAVYSILAEDSISASVEMLLISIAPHSETIDVSIHSMEEILFVLEGTVSIMFSANDIIELNSGDTIRILPNREHKLINNSNSMVLALNVKCKVRY